jgi:hypothetical protein
MPAFAEEGRSSGPLTGVLVLRVWLEPDATPGFRARVMARSDGERIEVFTSTDCVIAYVSRWLDDFVAGQT